MKFTVDQQKAIDERGKNLLISAGAGSGKTAVLSERVLALVNEGVGIDELVVLTFTNAAAQEMKLRIRKKFEANGSKASQEALEKLDGAHIQTFDAYALYIVKKYGYLMDIDKQVGVGDAVRLTLEAKRIMDALFDEYYSHNNTDFEAYVSTFEVKNDASLKEQIMHYYEALSLFANFEEKLDEYSSTYFSKAHVNMMFETYETLVLEVVQTLKDFLHDMENAVSDEASLDYVGEVKAHFEEFDQVSNYETCRVVLGRLEVVPTLRKTSAALKKVGRDDENDYLKASRASLKDLVEQLKRLCKRTEDEHHQDIFAMQDHMPIIRTLLLAFKERFERYQFDSGAMRFSTIATLAIRLVKDHEVVRNELMTSVHEVMIDEYQDTNKLQEAFVALITKDNVYQVGDVKQSIYRFRHAEPRLFTEKHHRYSRGEGGMVIDLDANFRSRKEILRDLNRVFEHTMDEEVGGIDYVGRQKLTYGNNLYDTLKDESMDYGLRILEYEEEDVQDYLDDKALKLEEMEMFLIADDIKQKVGTMDVVDMDHGVMRKARYDDFAILVSVSSQFDQFKKIFEAQKVPLAVLKNEPFMQYMDIDLYRHLFKLLYCFVDATYYKNHIKHSFMSVARSFAFEHHDDLIVSQVLDLPSSMPRDDKAFAEPFKPLINTLIDLAQASSGQDIASIFQHLIEAFHLYDALVRLPQTKSAVQRLDYLQELLRSLMHEGYVLADMVVYFDAMIDEGLDVEIAASMHDAQDQVKMMTIHKSKGLEFPVVYVPSLSRNWNRSTMKNYAFSERYGFLIPHEDDGLRESFAFALYKEELLKEDTSERLRVLYVALTRAKEMCIVPLNAKEKRPWHRDDFDRVKAFERRRYYKNYKDVLTSVKEELSHAVTPINLSATQFKVDYALQLKTETIDAKPLEGKIYQPPLVGEIKQSKQYSSEVSQLLDKDTFEAIEQGNRMHDYLERIDFFGDVLKQIKALTDQPSEQTMLKAFFDSALMQSLTIKQVYKEFPFSVLDENDVTSGYIDLLIETDSTFVIIDYKLKTIDKEAYFDQVTGYKDVLSTMTDKPIEGYLYSIVDRRFLRVI